MSLENVGDELARGHEVLTLHDAIVIAGDNVHGARASHILYDELL